MPWADYESDISIPPPDDTTTPTFEYILPDYAGDANVWGQWLNGNFLAIDLFLTDLIDTTDGPAKLPWALPKAGGELTGDISFERATPATESTRGTCGTAAKPAKEVHGLSFYVRALAGGAVTASITGAGVVTGTSVAATSDARLKRNIRNAPMAKLYRGVLALVPKLYTRISSNMEELGLVAQDVQHHLPECVSEQEDGTLIIHHDRLLAAVIGALVFGLHLQERSD